MSTFKWLIGELNNCRVGGVTKQLGKLLEIYVISLLSLLKKKKQQKTPDLLHLQTCRAAGIIWLENWFLYYWIMTLPLYALTTYD